MRVDDLLRRQLVVERTVTEVRGKVAVGSPKTAMAKRRVQIPQHLVTTLSEHMGRYTNDLMFPAEEGGLIRRSHFLRRVWALAARKAGLEGVTPHSLRHSHASWSIAQGVNVLALSRRLGHARPSITLDTYSHLWPGGDAEIADKLDELHAATNKTQPEPVSALPSGP